MKTRISSFWNDEGITITLHKKAAMKAAKLCKLDMPVDKLLGRPKSFTAIKKGVSV